MRVSSFREDTVSKGGGKSLVFSPVSGDFEAVHIFSHAEVTEGTGRHFSRKTTLFNF